MRRSSSSGSASRSRALLGLLLVALAAGDAAAAKKRVVVIPFSGPGAGPAEAAVTRVVRRRHSVVPAQKYTALKKKLGLSKPTDRNVAKISARLKVDAIVVGSVERSRGRFKLTVRVREGKSGEFAETITLPLKSRRLSKRDERALQQKLLPVLADLPAVDSGGDEEEEPVAARRGGFNRGRDDIDEEETEDEDEDEGDEEEEEEEAEEPARTAERDEPEEEPAEEPAPAPSADRGEEEEPAADDVVADRKVRGRGVDLAAGLSVSGRSFAFTVRDGLANRPNGYDGGMVPGAYVLAELYPLAMDPKKGGALRDLGVAFVFDRVLKIESKVMGSDEVIPTTQQRWGVGVRYRINFGKKPTSPSVKLGVGYNKFAFTLDKAAAEAMMLTVDLPNVDYTYYDPGLQVRFPVSPQLALVGEGKFLFVTATGEVQDTDQYGPGKVTGFDADVGIEYRVNERFLVHVGGRYLAIAFDFDGTGQLSNNRDMDPSSVDVGGALDKYLGGYLTAGYVF